MSYIIFNCPNCLTEIKAKILGRYFAGVVIEPTKCPNDCGMTIHAVELEEAEE